MDFHLPSYIKTAISEIEKNNKECFIVGGCVRDCIMGKIPDDWDMTTNALPEETKNIFSLYRTVDVGIQHGTVLVVIENKNTEITTYRIDGDYKDNRHPQNVLFASDIEKDLARRDFTVNAMAYNPKAGLVDVFGGIEDINNKILRCVGNPDDRFKEDALRIMRCIRFASVLDFTIEPETEKAMFENRNLLLNVSKERINAELVKLLQGKNVLNVLLKYGEIIATVIPELKCELNFRQFGKKHAYTVWGHICHTVNNIENDKILRLTMLLHDCGKPSTHILDEKGNSTFKSHGAVGGVIAENILKNLKFDKKTINTVSYLVSIHDMKVPATKEQVKQYLKIMGKENFIYLMKIRKADRSGLSKEFSDISDLLKKAFDFYDEICRNNEPYNISMLEIKGGDLTKIGIKNENTGIMLNKLTDFVIEHPEFNTKSDLMNFAKENYS